MEKNERIYAAHILREDPENICSDVIKVQTVQEHAEGVAEKAEEFAKYFHGEEFARICGLSHDIGKFSSGFQRRIWDGAPRVDHSTAGAQELMKVGSLSNLICAYCVAGHHAGLMDYSALLNRLKKKLNADLRYDSYHNFITIPKTSRWEGSIGKNPGFSLFLFAKMLFSCLVDADFLDTESFMGQGDLRNEQFDDMTILKAKIDCHIEEKGYLSGESGINCLRSKILKRCIEEGQLYDGGICTLTVPTGGGKTVASLAFALNHAVQQHRSRIIYVVPYCAIIDQTVEVFNTILGSHNVLAHYSEADYGDQHEIKKLAAENWDMPIVVTTAVQFFESIFSNRTSRCRKLHNITNSVIVFDEAQTIPREYLDPCICAIAELAVNYSTTCVLCTATQPALAPRFDKYYPQISIHELSESPEELYRAFKRVSYQFIGHLTDKQVSEKLLENNQILCIVSTRAQAKNIFELLPEEGRMHLSTLMTPEHRKRVISDIRSRLKAGEMCRVVSTSLIEAGVDLDFPIVYRSIAGLDSVIQAGGRCNREGRREDSKVYVFEPESKYKLPAVMKRPASVSEIIIDHHDDIAEPAIIKQYFSLLYELEEEDGCGPDQTGVLDKCEVLSGLQEVVRDKNLRFETISKDFCFISNDGVRVIFVPGDDESREVAESIEYGKVELTRSLFRKISRHCVNVYEHQYKELLPALHVIDDSLAVLKIPEEYDFETGLKFRFEGGDGMFC